MNFEITAPDSLIKIKRIRNNDTNEAIDLASALLMYGLIKGKSKGPKYQAPTIDITQAAKEKISFANPLKKPATPNAIIIAKENQSTKSNSMNSYLEI